MIEKIGHIKNPLSVIAIFAAIAEISGTTVLPFIEANNQSVYIWFLMFFPIFLVGAFFLTLNFNYRVLYAPSDYKDEKNFVSLFGKASPHEQSKKLQDEVEEVEADESHIQVNKVKRDKRREIMADVTLAERLAVNKLASNLGLDFKTDFKFDLVSSNSGSGNMSIVFDAVHFSDNSIQAIEVKLFKTSNIDYSRFSKIISVSEIISQSRELSTKDFTLHIFVVMDTLGVETEKIKKTIEKFTAESKIKVIIHVSTLSDLQNEYQYNT